PQYRRSCTAGLSPARAAVNASIDWLSSAFSARSRTASSPSSESRASSSARWAGVSDADPEQTAILRSCVVRPERTSSYSSVLIGASARWLQIAASESDIAGLTWRTQWGQRLAIQFQQQISRIFCGDIDGV